MSFLGLQAQGTITTVAGDGAAGSSGDGGAATSAAISILSGVAVDDAVNLYIAADNRIRKVNPAGIITTVAGNGTVGFSGDGGLATNAQLSAAGVVADSSGNFYIADVGNFRIRKVNSAGIITTVAGNGDRGFSGDGGLATSAQLSSPADVAVDASGNLYIADNNRIRMVNSAGIITTVAGNGLSGFSGDGGPAINAELIFPRRVAVDSSGKLYIADNNRIRMVNSVGVITTVAGDGTPAFSGDGGPASNAKLNGPAGVAFDNFGNLYIADFFNNRVRKVSPDAIMTTAAGNGTLGFSGDGGPATSAQISEPTAVAVDSSGNLYIADRGNRRIRRAAPCIATKLVLALNSLVTGSSVPAGFPISIEVLVNDDCGNPLNAGAVLVSFSNGDPAILLASLGNRRWAGTWTPRNAPSTVTLAFNAFSHQGGVNLAGQASVTLTLTTTSPVPTIAKVTDGASFQTNNALSPGTFVTIFGSNLASATAQATSLPLPTTLGSATVFAADRVLPIFYASPGQINAILPYDVPLDATQQLLIRNGLSYSTPVAISITTANPGVFTYGQNQGIVVDVANALISPSNAAPRGSVVVIYCAGLGATSPAVLAGTPAPVAVTTNPTTVTFGDVAASVLYAGLSPGFTGLYQINAVVPNTAPVGNQVPLVITVAGISSAVVNTAVK